MVLYLPSVSFSLLRKNHQQRISLSSYVNLTDHTTLNLPPRKHTPLPRRVPGPCKVLVISDACLPPAAQEEPPIYQIRLRGITNPPCSASYEPVLQDASSRQLRYIYWPLTGIQFSILFLDELLHPLDPVFDTLLSEALDHPRR